MKRPIHTFNLKGRIIVITGGYGHLGRAIVDSLLFHGGIVYVLGRSHEKYLRAFNVEQGGDQRALFNDNLFFQECDISSTTNIEE